MTFTELHRLQMGDFLAAWALRIAWDSRVPMNRLGMFADRLPMQRGQRA
jgi:hypothetical protein